MRVIDVITVPNDNIVNGPQADNNQGLTFDIVGTNAWYRRKPITDTFPYMCEFFKINP